MISEFSALKFAYIFWFLCVREALIAVYHESYSRVLLKFRLTQGWPTFVASAKSGALDDLKWRIVYL